MYCGYVGNESHWIEKIYRAYRIGNDELYVCEHDCVDPIVVNIPFGRYSKSDTHLDGRAGKLRDIFPHEYGLRGYMDIKSGGKKETNSGCEKETEEIVGRCIRFFRGVNGKNVFFHYFRHYI